MTITPTPPEVSAQHTEALAARKPKSDRVRYAIEHNPSASVPELLDWLATHGANPGPLGDGEITRTYAAGIVKSYREGRRTTDTADLPRLTDEVLAEFDAATPSAITGEPVQTDPDDATGGVWTDQSDSVQTPPTEPIESTPRATVPVEIVPTAVATPAVIVATPVRTPIEPVQTVPAAPTAQESISASAEMRTSAPAGAPARGTGPFYLVALIASLISIDTALRYFTTELHIDGFVSFTMPLWNGATWTVTDAPVERWALAAVVEITLIACGYAMRHAVRRPGGTPGPSQVVALGFAGVSVFMALQVSDDLSDGLVRAALGPVLALVALHLALGIEVHVRSGGTRSGTLTKVIGELRERALSRLGLGDDDRDAVTRTRDRAVDRAARLASAKWVIGPREVRLARAIRQSGVATDPAARERLKAQVAAQKNVKDLISMSAPSPWQD